MDDSDKQQKSVRHKRKYFSRRKWVFIVIVIVIFVAVLFGGWLYISNKTSPAQVTRSDEEIDRLITTARNLDDNGDTNGAIAKFEEIIKQTSNSDQKYYLLCDEAIVYYNSGKYDDAMATLKLAETIDSKSANVAGFMASIYATKGDKQKAIEYYEKAISFLDKSSTRYKEYIEDFQAKITGLKGVGN